MRFYFYGAIISAAILYINTVAILKKTIKQEETSMNTIIGTICSMVIVTSILLLCMR